MLPRRDTLQVLENGFVLFMFRTLFYASKDYLTQTTPDIIPYFM